MRQLLREMLKDWKERDFPSIIEREDDPLKLVDWKVVKAIPIVGFRRTGKTFLLLNVAKKVGKENSVYIDFEDERIPRKKEILTEFSRIVKEEYGRRKLFLLLDEVHEVPEWSRWVRRMLDTGNCQIIISGSSSKLSLKELPTELRGRSLPIEMHPLSFKEFLNFKNEKVENLSEGLILNLAREYLEFGGLPEIVLSEKSKKFLIIDEYFKTFLTRDIFERYGIRNRSVMVDLIRLLLNSTYTTFSKSFETLKSLGHKVGKETVANYFQYLESSFFINLIEVCSPKVKESIKASKKVSAIDNFFIKRFSSRFSEDIGRLMENLVFLHTKRMRKSNPMLEVFYWKDYQQNEVDLVLKDGLRIKQLIQVTYASGRDEIEKRETKALTKAAEQLKCKDLLIITWDLEDELKVNNEIIRCVPLWKWLFGNALK
ncbi:MAG: ATP-binding protein [Thermoproteota archaeon]